MLGCHRGPRHSRPLFKPTPCVAFSSLCAACQTLNVNPPTMSVAQVLQHLYSLNTTSPDFMRYLYCLIQSDEEEQYLSSLQGSELTQLVDFLDEVHPLFWPLSSLRNRPHRYSTLPQSLTMFPGDAYTNYKQCAVITQFCHLRTPFQAISHELVMTWLPLVVSPTCGKESITAPRSASNT